jgi:ABC-type phosphate transport system substrate-binding protein
MRQFFKIFLLFSLAALTCASLAQAEPNAPIIAIVVASNQKVDVLKLAPNDLSLIYWRKQLYWPKGQRIKPVNLSTEHALRLQFSQKILGSAPKSQIDYWNGQYFDGVLPPYSVNSEEAVLRYVAQTQGAIGYVNACNVDTRVQAVLWIEDNQITTKAPEGLNCDKTH